MADDDNDAIEEFKFEQCFSNLERARKAYSESQNPISAAENYMNIIAEYLTSKCGKDKALDIIITVASISMGKSVYGLSNGKLTKTDLTNVSRYLKEECCLSSEEYTHLIEFGNCWRFFKELTKRPPFIQVLNRQTTLASE